MSLKRRQLDNNFHSFSFFNMSSVPNRRSSYSVKFKVFVVEWQRKNNTSLHKTVKEFSVDRKRVREWSDKHPLLKAQSSGDTRKASPCVLWQASVD